uniref:NOL1/NOP2/Sun domain family member 4 n=1 Tax=Hirondellea gigas TaxID=1518452 RepID=A0A2P2I6T1_9CRUS
MEVLVKKAPALRCLTNIHRTQINILRNSSFNKQKPVTNMDRALQYFDVSYQAVYGREWPSMRIALLCQNKYVAILNNYCANFEQNKQRFENLGCFDLGAKYRINCLKMQSKLKLLQPPVEAAEDNTEDAGDSDDQQEEECRIPVRQMNDDELAELANMPAPRRYPSHFRELADTHGGSPQLLTSSEPSYDRVLLPQLHISPELQAHGIQDFLPSDNIKGIEEDDEFTEDTDVFDKLRMSSTPGDSVSFVDEVEFLHWPEMLTVMGFPRADISTFHKPLKDNGLFDHFALDGASILPVLLLGVKEGDSVLDMCAGPGGKTFALLQTCLTGVMQSNDVNLNRVKRIENIIQQYYEPQCKVLKSHRITVSDGCNVTGNRFDRVLVDVPCLTDRHCLQEHEGNIFQKSRQKERVSIPEKQADLLVSAIKHVKVGGSVVYSTCTLTPIQNDGVVHLALNTLWDHTDIECQVVNLSGVLDPLRFAYKFSIGKYGTLVLPWLPNNYGPMYFAKLVRTK